MLLFKINHSCGAGNKVNNFLQKFTHFKGISHKAMVVCTVKATDQQKHEEHFSANTSNMVLSTLVTKICDVRFAVLKFGWVKTHLGQNNVGFGK